MHTSKELAAADGLAMSNVYKFLSSDGVLK
jgi:hypothetical protein